VANAQEYAPALGAHATARVWFLPNARILCLSFTDCSYTQLCTHIAIAHSDFVMCYWICLV
jgi:hypothetical protein